MSIMQVTRVALTVACFGALTGCMDPKQLPAMVDELFFGRFGATLFSNPEQLSLKEIHLDTGTLAGREIVVEGKVAQVSEHSTYLVLTDDSARMLVVLTDLESVGPTLAHMKPKAMRVLGTVESGKKGLPFIKAHAVSELKETVPVAAAANGKA